MCVCVCVCVCVSAAGYLGFRTVATKRASHEDVTADKPANAVLSPSVKKSTPAVATEYVDKQVNEFHSVRFYSMVYFICCSHFLLSSRTFNANTTSTNSAVSMSFGHSVCLLVATMESGFITPFGAVVTVDHYLETA